MAFLTTEPPKFDSSSPEKSFKSLHDYVTQLREELKYILMSLDSMNVTSLDTNETRIADTFGTTEIVGAMLKMKDKDKHSRLNMGYDYAVNKFIFELLDSSGNKNFYLDDNAQVRMAGKPFIQMSDNTRVRLKMGYDTSINKFIFSLINIDGIEKFYVDDTGKVYANDLVISGGSISIGSNFSVNNQGNLTASNAYITGTVTSSTISGSTISGGSISIGSTNQIVINNTGIKCYKSGSLHGFCLDTNSWGDVELYYNGTKFFRITYVVPGVALQYISGTGSIYEILNSYNGSTNTRGSWNFSGSINSGLYNSTSGDHAHTITIDGTTYWTTINGSHTHTIS